MGPTAPKDAKTARIKNKEMENNKNLGVPLILYMSKNFHKFGFLLFIISLYGLK